MNASDVLIDAECDQVPAPRPTPAGTHGRRVLLAVSVVLIAFNLRPVFSSLSVVLPEIMASTGLSPAGASLLTTLPIVCLGLFAMLAPRLGRRFGTERSLLGCMVLILVGTLLRGTGSVPLLFVATAVAGTGIAVANVLLSGLVKRAAVVTLLWAPQAWRVAPIASESGFAVRGLWRDPLAWQVTLFMGLQSALAYSVMGWLAPILRERGLSGTTAGYVVSLSVIVQVVTCLGVPALAVRARHQRGLAAGVAVLIVAAMLGSQFAPIGQIWWWAVLLGIAQGGAFALALTLIVLRSRDAHVAAQLSGMAQGVGYLVAAFGPLLVGLLRGWTGSFEAAALLYLLLG
ncbi:MAG: cyanate transporter, partial [Comamonadaceae bacterium]